MSAPRAEAETDAYRCWQLAICAMREKRIRSGQILPDARKPDEVRWAAEGPRDPHKLDAVRE